MRALEEQKSLHSKYKPFDDIVLEHYESLIKNYVSVDIIDCNDDFSKYDLIVAPILYMTSEETVAKYINSFPTAVHL